VVRECKSEKRETRLFYLLFSLRHSKTAAGRYRVSGKVKRIRMVGKQDSLSRNFLTFVNTTAIGYGQKIARSLNILVACNGRRVYKRQKITGRSQSKIDMPDMMTPCR